MAAHRSIQEKVNRLINKKNGKPVLKPSKPLVLKDFVATRKQQAGQATCITEMGVMMACWKRSNFSDETCSPEIKSFYACVQDAQAAMKKKKKSESTQQGGRLSSEDATTLLKRFPNLRTEI
ncbi:small ribosomal subunit protein mS37 [Brachionichthys hirsutus]|uniref:small ribosomal subunit protein mS37 n=1 Tax=Brachionichthys hirsutus TaxID=412623 RepID=UPI003604CF59